MGAPSPQDRALLPPRSDDGGAKNLRPGCPGGGHEIPQLWGEIGKEGLIPWDAVEEIFQVRKGTIRGRCVWEYGFLSPSPPPGALCGLGGHLQVTLLLGLPHPSSQGMTMELSVAQKGQP